MGLIKVYREVIETQLESLRVKWDNQESIGVIRSQLVYLKVKWDYYGSSGVTESQNLGH